MRIRAPVPTTPPDCCTSTPGTRELRSSESVVIPARSIEWTWMTATLAPAGTGVCARLDEENAPAISAPKKKQRASGR